ncbi:hypothetical protein GEV33_006410 [Tenebrio molitor]|uniref:Uncharacterized protein n=1 Tax=Tenebrio molitor TaxID=7067 RepID=A0A8J6LJZ7_TENMO|nr:hypothetical protein GEV33_006410 [Tenebrio molitor]
MRIVDKTWCINESKEQSTSVHHRSEGCGLSVRSGGGKKQDATMWGFPCTGGVICIIFLHDPEEGSVPFDDSFRPKRERDCYSSVVFFTPVGGENAI